MRDPRVVEERYWDGSLRDLKALCAWVNSFDLLGDPILTPSYRHERTP